MAFMDILIATIAKYFLWPTANPSLLKKHFTKRPFYLWASRPRLWRHLSKPNAPGWGTSPSWRHWHNISFTLSGTAVERSRVLTAVWEVHGSNPALELIFSDWKIIFVLFTSANDQDFEEQPDHRCRSNSEGWDTLTLLSLSMKCNM